jgi:hypothetical protein
MSKINSKTFSWVNYLLFFWVLYFPLISHAQVKPKAIRVMALSEATTMPTYKVVKLPFHAGVLIGADLWTKSGAHWQQAFGVDLSYYYHRFYEHAIMIDGLYTLGYKFNFGLQVNLPISIGYKHSILTGEVYKLENGSYKEIYDLGKAQFNGKLGIGLEFPVTDKLSIRADYRYMVALPYMPEKDMPFSLHSLFGLGCTIKLEKKGPVINTTDGSSN